MAKPSLAQDGPEPVVGADSVEVARVALLHDAATEGVLGDADAMAIAVLCRWGLRCHGRGCLGFLLGDMPILPMMV